MEFLALPLWAVIDSAHGRREVPIFPKFPALLCVGNFGNFIGDGWLARYSVFGMYGGFRE
jgi:hypothetical protein